MGAFPKKIPQAATDFKTRQRGGGGPGGKGGARAAWSKRGCGDSHRREPGKHKHRRCERPLSSQPSEPVIGRPGSRR
ncbi:unnamed protein product [Pleuronectes platessa]|uniref:Uncharacterized protein n=1 Tax=Pleuronectes platessa TaxID=8262 RepID=A0A9N7YXM5_PLEPL|nr:unnamed protein product [Pleuronectes platessa]